MRRLYRVSFRAAVPLIIGLALIVVTLTLLATTPVTAAVDSSSIAQPHAKSPLQPQSIITITRVPIGVPSPIVDGDCNATEYTGGITQTFSDAFGFTATLRMVHDNGNLYICMIGATGTFPPRFASVYLDTRDDREPYAGANDYALRIDIITGTTSSFKGTGVPNGYTPILLNNWNAARTFGNFDTAEYSIWLPLTGGWCGDPFGLAVYHHWLAGTGDDYGWPSAQWYDQPATWQEVVLDQANCASGKIAYVFKEDSYTAGKFKTLIEGAGFTVDLIPLSTVTSTIFGSYDAIIVADDTGSLDQWGTGPGQTTPITIPNKPIIGLGEGGYAFFGKLGKFIGWPQGWHGPQSQVLSANPALPYYHDPFDFSGLTGGLFLLYPSPVNEVGIYVSSVPTDVTVIGYEPPSNPQANPDHAPLIQQGCNQLWGYSNGPQDMNDNGHRLFVNAVVYARYYSQCPNPPPPPPPGGCVTVVKTAQPAPPAHVQPGDIITYTINYTVSDHSQCATAQATLIDQIPFGAKYVPGSASGGINTNIEDTLIWPLGNLPPAAHGSQTFALYVLDTACNNQVITNSARLRGSTGAFDSNVVTHQVDCPPVIPPNVEPPYAEEEIQIYPYPLITGHATQLSARVRSLSATTQTVTVTFQSSPNNFGIGLNFNALPIAGNPRVVTLPPYSTVEVQLDWTPATSGHYCIQVKIEGAGFRPIYTQRNLDVTEDLRPGVTDDLTFFVGNPTTQTARIDLVVDNTCPGWTASVTPTFFNAVGPNDTDIRTATLHVTPPTSGVLGTGCHIDVQGWINSRLIGGIRKLDVPPVHLPHSPVPWEEKEITVNPDPAVVGQPTQYCIELQNPLPFSRTVTLTYTVADFGAGIGFTPVGTRTVTLPPNSIDKYCITWTPTASNNLHRCLLVILHQPGFEDQHSQHNIDLVRANPAGSLISFTIGNPYPFTRTLRIVPELVGMAGLVPHITPDPPPDVLGPGQMHSFFLEVREAALKPNASTGGVLFGDTNRVEVSLYLGGDLESGFTVEFSPFKVFLPIVMK